MIRHCTECGTAFNCPPSAKIVTCSKACSKSRRSRIMLGKPQPKWGAASKHRARLAAARTGNLSGGTEAARGSLHRRKHWTVRDHMGRTHQVHGLGPWLREHPALMPPGVTPEQMYAGLRTMAAAMRGKTTRAVNHSHGWELLVLPD